jgi:hypothetical protein
MFIEPESARGDPAELQCRVGWDEGCNSGAARFGIDASLMDEIYRLEMDDARPGPSNIRTLEC